MCYKYSKSYIFYHMTPTRGLLPNYIHRIFLYLPNNHKKLSPESFSEALQQYLASKHNKKNIDNDLVDINLISNPVNKLIFKIINNSSYASEKNPIAYFKAYMKNDIDFYYTPRRIYQTATQFETLDLEIDLVPDIFSPPKRKSKYKKFTDNNEKLIYHREYSIWYCTTSQRPIIHYLFKFLDDYLFTTRKEIKDITQKELDSIRNDYYLTIKPYIFKNRSAIKQKAFIEKQDLFKTWEMKRKKNKELFIYLNIKAYLNFKSPYQYYRDINKLVEEFNNYRKNPVIDFRDYLP